MKLTVSRSKNSASFYVQKTIRKENGAVTTVTVEKLGNLEEVKARAGGMDPYQWAQEYVNELNRREYEEQKSIIIARSPSKLLKKDEKHLYNCGYLFLQGIYYSLGLHRICQAVSQRHKFEYDLNDVLSRLVYTRIIYPSSKLSSYQQSSSLIEQPAFRLHDVYRALSVLAEENDFIQSELYKNSQKVCERRRDILYYDCTNYYFELEEPDDLRKYGKSKQHQPLPLVGMGLFMDYDGFPLAFDIFPGNKNEQPTLKPLEKKVLKDYELGGVIVCTDAGLSSMANRKFNNKTLNGELVRGFITTQSVKALPGPLKEFALGNDGWHLIGDEKTYRLDQLDEEEYFDKVFYKVKWIAEDISGKKLRQGERPLEQRLVVSFSLKYRNYQERIRQGQVDRAKDLIITGKYKQRAKNQNDPHRFIGCQNMTDSGEACEQEIPYLKEDLIAEEEQYDGFYAVCTNLEDLGVEARSHLEKGEPSTQRVVNERQAAVRSVHHADDVEVRRN